MIESPDQPVRERILAAAMREFGHAGLHGARTRTICGLAGVNVSTLHYHFGSKEDLFRQTVTGAARVMVDVLDGIRSRPDGDLPTLVQEMGTAFAAQPDVPRVLLQAILERSDQSSTVLDTIAATIREVAEPMDSTRPHLNPQAVVLTAASLLVTMGLLEPVRERLGDVTAWDMQAAIAGMFQAMFDPTHEEATAETPSATQE